jgi:hypothetical protein
MHARTKRSHAKHTGAAHLAKSLAEDLLACEGLRASPWPSGSAA